MKALLQTPLPTSLQTPQQTHYSPYGSPQYSPRMGPKPHPQDSAGGGGKDCQGVGSTEQPHTAGVKFVTRVFKAGCSQPPPGL